MNPAAEAATKESANAAAVAQEAAERSQATQIATLIQSGLEEFFKRGIDGKRFMPLDSSTMADKERFKFICDDISDIHTTLKEWDKDRITTTDFALLRQKADLTNKIVFAFIGVICLGFMAMVFAQFK